MTAEDEKLIGALERLAAEFRWSMDKDTALDWGADAKNSHLKAATRIRELSSEVGELLALQAEDDAADRNSQLEIDRLSSRVADLESVAGELEGAVSDILAFRDEDGMIRLDKREVADFVARRDRARSLLQPASEGEKA